MNDMNTKKNIVYWLGTILVLALLFFILTACNQRACPAYNETSSGQTSNQKPFIIDGNRPKNK